jgi:hypothetical protein
MVMMHKVWQSAFSLVNAYQYLCTVRSANHAASNQIQLLVSLNNLALFLGFLSLQSRMFRPICIFLRILLIYIVERMAILRYSILLCICNPWVACNVINLDSFKDYRSLFTLLLSLIDLSSSTSQHLGLRFLNTSDAESLPIIAEQDARRIDLKKVGGVCTSLPTLPLVAKMR